MTESRSDVLLTEKAWSELLAIPPTGKQDLLSAIQTFVDNPDERLKRRLPTSGEQRSDWLATLLSTGHLVVFRHLSPEELARSGRSASRGIVIADVVRVDETQVGQPAEP